MSKFKNVDEYIDKAPDDAQDHLAEMRELFLSSTSDIEEGISWNIPFYKYQGPIGGFDAFSKHMSFGPWHPEVLNETRKTLEEKGYKVLKSTLQIRYDQRIPGSEIKKMLKASAKINESK